MKIDSYQVGMDSARSFSSSSTRKLSFGYTKHNFEGSLGNMTDNFSEENGANIDSQKQNAANGDGGPANSLKDVISSMQSPLNRRIHEIEANNSKREIDNVHHKFVVYLWRLLFGNKKADDMAKEFGFSDAYQNEPNAQGQSTSYITLQGFRESYYEESEALSFSSEGTVTCEDGRTINFNLELEMSRSFSEYYREEGLAITSMCDPLVINYSGDVAELTDTKITFDLDCDGVDDQISTLAEGSGFLSLDLNNDGIINDGSELFGTKSGDGFADLASYDSDHNGWIDENDDIFDRLKIWVKDNNGSDTLYSLKDKNVGAIYLGNADTNYTLRSTANGSVNGAIRKTGLFLYEDGTGVGTINHLDIAN